MQHLTQSRPPQFWLRFFRWYCDPDFQEDIEGDLLERFDRNVKVQGQKAARWRFAKDVMALFRPGIIKSIQINTQPNHTAMLKHNLLITYRSFLRNKSSFLINLVGLSSGLACVLLIYLWVNDELMVDKFHENDSQLYQVMENQKNAEGFRTVEWTPGPLAEALAQEFPEVESAVTVMPYSWFPEFNVATETATDKNINAVGQFAGEDYFNLFSYKLLQGDASQVLADKKGAVISEALARRLFHTTDNVVGKVIDWQFMQFKGQSTITGIFENIPASSTQQFDLVMPYAFFNDAMPRFNENWEASAPSTYVLLKEGTNVSLFNQKIADYVKTKSKSSNVTLFARQYASQYLYGNYENGVQQGGRIEYVRLFAIIAIFILIIACINFMNLSTAQATRRMKEVGVKKSMGAGRKALIFQYLTESILATFLSLCVAVVLAVALLPAFNGITGKQLTLDFDMRFIVSLLVITLITGLFAGSYPALYLSGFNPVKILKGRLNHSFGTLWVRKGLVVFQFTLSVILIVGVLVVYKQIDFVQNKNLGYDKENIIYFPIQQKIAENLETFLTEVEKIPGIVNASSSLHTLIGTYSTTSDLNWMGKTPDDDISFEDMEVNYDMIETLGLKLKAGRSFSENLSNEESKIVFNETAIAAMGLQDPIGKEVELFGQKREIIGVVNDFNFQSLHDDIKPVFFILNPKNALIITAKIQAGRERETIGNLEEFYETYNAGASFDYKFMDEEYQALYTAEQRVSSLSKYFALLAIIISCLGLFGLATFTIERRMKEVGVRKILGSSNSSIVMLLSGDFSKMILVAIVIALPISYFLAQRWLEGFAFRIALEWWFFAGASLVALFIAWLSIGYQTIKAARIDPVQCLKDE